MVLLGLLLVIVLLVVFNCTISCGKEGFLSQFNDQIADPFAYDFANSPSVYNPVNLRWNSVKKEVPLDQSTSEYPYIGLSGDIFRPKMDNGYCCSSGFC